MYVAAIREDLLEDLQLLGLRSKSIVNAEVSFSDDAQPRAVAQLKVDISVASTDADLSKSRSSPHKPGQFHCMHI